MMTVLLWLGLFALVALSHPRLAFWLMLAGIFHWVWRAFRSGPASDTPRPEISQRRESSSHGRGSLAPMDLADLLFLQRSLREGHERGRLDTARWEALDRQIETLLSAGLETADENRMRRLERAWGLLNWHSDAPLGPPPWSEPPPETTPEPASPAVPASIRVLAPTITPETPALAEPVLHAEAVAAMAKPEPALAIPAVPGSPLHEVLRPVEPGPLELALKAAGRQWAAFTPFLVQNIGWFLGGFCFVAGSMFLVAYTTGFAKALSVWASLSLYVFLLLGGGSYLRLKRPELRTAGLMLLCLSAALIPLALAAGARLWLTADSAGGWFVAAVAAGLDLAGFGLALPLVAGGIDRRLAATQPRLFLALAAVQLLAPLLHAWPHWAFLATGHIALVVLLAMGLRALLRDWLPAAPDERSRLAAYAGGSLLYAAAVSYAHLGLTLPGPLPAGYHGPFLMAVCGLGFYGEARVKGQGRDSIWLSRLSFLWYGLSATALALAFPGTGPRVAALALGAVLYAGVVCRYLSLVPLYALALCLAWLYAELVLFRLPGAVWLWAAAPLWYGLARLNRYALHRRSESLATIARRLLAGLLIAAGIWSLLHSTPGWIGCSTALLAAALAETHRRAVPDGNSGEALIGAYAAPLLVLLALAYAPLLPGLERPGQCVLGLGLFQILGLEWVLRRTGAWIGRPSPDEPSVVPMSPLLDWVLVALPITLALACVVPVPSIMAAGPLLSTVMLIRLGRTLCCRWALYLALALLGIGIALVKLAYVPGSSGGLSLFLAALAVYAVLRREETRPEAVLQWEALRAGRFLPVRLWSRILLELPEDAERESLWAGPLRAAFVALWAAGLLLLALRGTEVKPDALWAVSALAGMAVSRLVVARFGLSFLMVLVHGLGLAAVHILLAHGDGGLRWSLITSAYGLVLVWPQDLLASRAPWLRKLAPWTPEVATWNAGLGFCFSLAALAATVIAAWDRAMPAALPGCLVGAAAVLVYARGREWLWAPAAGFLAGTVVLTYATLNGLGLRDMPEERVLPVLLAVLGIAGEWLADRAALRGGRRLPSSEPVPGVGEGALARLVRLTAAWWGAVAAVQVFWQVGLGPQARPDLLHCAALASASVALWLAGRGLRLEILAEFGVFAGVVVLLWLEALAMGMSFGYWAPLAADRWLVLGGIALALGAAGNVREDREPPHWLRVVGGCWLWALAHAGALAVLWFAGSAADAALWLPGLWAMLAAALVPLRPLCGTSNREHGLAVALLLVAGGYGLLAFAPSRLMELSFAGAFLLLLVSWWTIPAWNARFVRWELDGSTWPWLALALVGAALATGGLHPATVWLAAVWLILWAYTSGLTAPVQAGTLGIVLGGLLACHEIIDVLLPAMAGDAPLALTAAAGLAWLMLLSASAKWLRTTGEASETGRFRLTLALSLELWTALALALALAADAVVVAMHLPAWPRGMEPVWLLPGLLLAAALGLRFRLSGEPLAGQALIPALLLCWLVVDLALSTPFHPATALLIPAALVAYAAGRAEGHWTEPLAAHLQFWRAAVPCLVVLALVLLPRGTPFDLAFCLAGLGTLAALVGRQLGDRVWLRASGLAFLILIHLWPWWAFGLAAMPGWAALQLAVWGEVAASEFMQHWLPPTNAPLAGARRESARFAAGLAGVEWTGAVIAALAGFESSPLPALAAGLLLLGPGAFREFRQPEVNRSRANLWLMVGSLLLARVLARSHVMPDATDGVALIALGYAALGLYERFRLGSLLNLARLLPALAWLPVADRPEIASPILAAAGTLYLLSRHGEHERLWLWLGILALNLGVYLWVPGLSRSSGLIQVYALPAAVSALVLVHLHRGELRPTVRHGVRLAAIATLYASAGADLFLRPELPVFVLALFLSLIGVGIGIAFRIRALLYGGTAFLVLTVLGQMVRLYPEDRLARALVLMALGTAITVAMIGFQIKREELLRRIRIVRADLGRWE